MALHIELDEGDLDEMMIGIVADLLIEMTNDLLNKIEENIVEMDLIGWTHQLLTDIWVDFEKHEIHVNAPWGGYVEFGTPGNESVPVDPWSGTDLAGPQMSPGRKGPPPLKPMTKWARVKGATKVGGKARYPTKSDAEQTAEQIRWSIYHHGTKAHPFIRNAIDWLQNEYEHTTVTIEVAFA